MKNWNLRTLVFMRSLCMVMLPMWFWLYRSGIPGAFLWVLALGAAMWVKGKLDEEINAQMDECAQALYDKLSQHMEFMTYVLVVVLIVFLVALPKADDPGAMGPVAAQILAWGMFGIYLYRGIVFWIRDRMGSIC